MIVRMQTGSSFRGAALYHFHDKRDPSELFRDTTRRVAWIETINCANNDPQMVIEEMAAVSEFHDVLKREAGHGLGGRPCDEPVLTVSLSWHPDQKPSKEHMQQTARDFLEHMNLDEHQAILLAHNDTKHQHVHLIVNRVHPREGLVHDDSYSHNRAMRWRDDYIREHGIMRQTDRAAEKHLHRHAHLARDGRAIQEHYEQLAALGAHAIEQAELSRRAQPDKLQLRQHPHDQDHYAALGKTHDHTQLAAEREQLAARHKQEREAFLATNKQEFKQVRETAYREVRDAFASRWRGMYVEEKKLKQELKNLRKEMSQRAMQFAREHKFVEAWQCIHHPSEASLERSQGLAEITKARTALRTEQRDAARKAQNEACKVLIGNRDRVFVVLKDRQTQDRGELHGIQTARDHNEPYSHQRLQELLRPHHGLSDKDYSSMIAAHEHQAATQQHGMNYQSMIAEHELRGTTLGRKNQHAAEKSEPVVTKPNRLARCSHY